MYQNLFIHSSVNEHLGCLHVLAIVNSTAMNIGVAIVQLLSCVHLFTNPWTSALQASLSFTISWSLLKHISIELVMPSNHLILCHPLLLLPSLLPNSWVFSDESALCIR